MSIFKRGNVYWYKFMWNGEVIRESTRQGNDRKAHNIEAAHRTALANGLVGIREKKQAPTLRSFCDDRFEPWARASFEKNMVNNWYWFRTGIRALLSYKPLANAKLDTITNELAAEFAARRMSSDIQVSSVNSSLRVLQRALRLAKDWGVIDAAPVVSLLSGELHRERVVTPEEESAYLDKAPEPLKPIATVLADTGLRPEECYRMRWEELNWNNGKFGTILVTHGKTRAARRSIPMTPRVRFILETRCELAKMPLSG